MQPPVHLLYSFTKLFNCTCLLKSLKFKLKSLKFKMDLVGSKPKDTVEVPSLAETAYLQRNVRGGGFIFSAEMAQYWMDHLDVKYIVRAHELQQEVRVA